MLRWSWLNDQILQEFCRVHGEEYARTQRAASMVTPQTVVWSSMTGKDLVMLARRPYRKCQSYEVQIFWEFFTHNHFLVFKLCF